MLVLEWEVTYIKVSTVHACMTWVYRAHSLTHLHTLSPIPLCNDVSRHLDYDPLMILDDYENNRMDVTCA
jgi:hypothetical protein